MCAQSFSKIMCVGVLSTRNSGSTHERTCSKYLIRNYLKCTCNTPKTTLFSLLIRPWFPPPISPKLCEGISLSSRVLIFNAMGGLSYLQCVAALPYCFHTWLLTKMCFGSRLLIMTRKKSRPINEERHFRYTLPRDVPHKAISVSPQMHQALKSYAKKHGYTLTEAVWQLLTFALDKQGWPEDIEDIEVIPPL